MYKRRRKRLNKKSAVKYLKYKAKASHFICQRVEHYKRIYNVEINRISIRNQRTRWGSCSKKGNLNFNYRVFLLPKYMADYVIVHEICHLKEFNHSRKFWDLVAVAVPNHTETRRIIRKINFK